MLKEFKKLDFYKINDNFKPFKDIKVNKIFGDLSTKIPKYTIVIITFKRPDLLKEALDSAINQQGFKDYEILIYDNDYTQDTETERMLWQYHKKHKNIYYYKTTDTAEISYGSWNLGILNSRTEWVTMLHDDDLLNPNWLKTVDAILQKHPEIEGLAPKYDILFYDCKSKKIINNEKIKLSAKIKSFLRKYKLLSPKKTKYQIGKYSMDHYYIRNAAFAPVGIMYKRENIIKIGGWQLPKYFGCEDYIFNVNYMLNYNLYYTTEILAKKRESEQGDSSRKQTKINMTQLPYVFYKSEDSRSKIKYLKIDDWYIMATIYFIAMKEAGLNFNDFNQDNEFDESQYTQETIDKFNKKWLELNSQLEQICPPVDNYSYNIIHNVKWN